MMNAQPLMVERYAEAYTEFKMPDRLPIGVGKSREISLFLESPEEWAKDLLTRIGRGTEKIKSVPDFSRLRTDLTNEIALNKSLLEKHSVQEVYGGTELLLCANSILAASIHIYKNEGNTTKVFKTFSFRKMLSIRPLAVVICGTVNIREIIKLGMAAHKKKDLNAILSYRTFVDEYLSYLTSFDPAELPDEPIATFEEIDEMLRGRG